MYVKRVSGVIVGYSWATGNSGDYDEYIADNDSELLDFIDSIENPT